MLAMFGIYLKENSNLDLILQICVNQNEMNGGFALGDELYSVPRLEVGRHEPGRNGGSTQERLFQESPPVWMCHDELDSSLVFLPRIRPVDDPLLEERARLLKQVAHEIRVYLFQCDVEGEWVQSDVLRSFHRFGVEMELEVLCEFPSLVFGFVAHGRCASLCAERLCLYDALNTSFQMTI